MHTNSVVLSQDCVSNAKVIVYFNENELVNINTAAAKRFEWYDFVFLSHRRSFARSTVSSSPLFAHEPEN